MNAGLYVSRRLYTTSMKCVIESLHVTPVLESRELNAPTVNFLIIRFADG